MSKTDDFHRRQHLENAESFDKLIGSGNVCSDNLSVLESEDFEVLRGRDARGAGSATLARFWSKVNPTGPVPPQCPELGRCWDWTGSQTHGYGQFVLPRDLYGKQPHFYAHRFAYELSFGLIGDPSIKACHRCDRPTCVRPSHLFLGTQPDNLNDARRKGRLVDGAHLIKLSALDMLTIRETYVPRGNGKQLAARYGVTLTTILRVVAGTQRVAKRAPQALASLPQQSDRNHHVTLQTVEVVHGR